VTLVLASRCPVLKLSQTFDIFDIRWEGVLPGEYRAISLPFRVLYWIKTSLFPCRDMPYGPGSCVALHQVKFFEIYEVSAIIW
jgi:hypothetical protein